MTKDVLVSISGLHMDMDAQIPGPDEDDVIEVVTPATYYYRNGKHYIIYDEIVEGVSDTIKNKIKISGTDSLEIMKSGLSNTHMIFEKKQEESDILQNTIWSDAGRIEYQKYGKLKFRMKRLKYGWIMNWM